MIDLKRTIAQVVSPRRYRQLQTIYGRLYDRLFDAYRGVETFDRDHEGAEHHTPDSVEYRPTQPDLFRHVFRTLGVQPGDVFLDLGAGKGRVLLLAAELPFRRVIGVEISEILSAHARANVERVRGRLVCQDVEVVTTDAASYAIPDDVTTIYMYNPFRGQTFETVVRNVLQSVERRPRRITLVYYLPTMHGSLIANGFRVVSQDLPAVAMDGGLPFLVVTYRLDAASSAHSA